jgi:hypothetical protein
VKAVISKPGQKVTYTFAGTANKHVTFQVTNFNFSNGSSNGAVYLDFYKPGSTSIFKTCTFTGDSYCDFIPTLTGTWKVTLVPDGASVGSLILTFANDVASKALASGTPVTTTIKFEGQHAGYTFASTAGATRTFDVTQFNFTDGSSNGAVYLDFYKPGSTSVYQTCTFTGNGSCNLTTLLTGTWSVELVPDGASVGSLTLTMI